MDRMWMVRAEGGTLYELFRERGVAAVGWTQLAAAAKPRMSRRQLIDLYLQAEPEIRQGTAISGASQVWRFINEVAMGDWVVTYSPSYRSYMLGRVRSASEYRPEWADDGMALARAIEWLPVEIYRDALTQPTKNSLGSTLTVFMVPEHAMQELLAIANEDNFAKTQVAVLADDRVVDEEIVDPFKDIEVRAREAIKDMISALDWSQMQELIAGILRAMGYKTRVSPAGSDLGKDILASPDGQGFSDPRIIVEVKHRVAKSTSEHIRNFTAGRHANDHGLFVSTSGFTKDAIYEAERANIRMMIWNIDDIAKALVDHYRNLDIETQRMVPLKWTYWPA